MYANICISQSGHRITVEKALLSPVLPTKVHHQQTRPSQEKLQIFGFQSAIDRFLILNTNIISLSTVSRSSLDHIRCNMVSLMKRFRFVQENVYDQVERK